MTIIAHTKLPSGQWRYYRKDGGALPATIKAGDEVYDVDSLQLWEYSGDPTFGANAGLVASPQEGSVITDHGALAGLNDNDHTQYVLAQGGFGSSYKLARGVHQIAAAQDTVATGLTTVVAVVVSLRDAPTANIFAVAASIGNQSGAPAAGSFLLNSYKTPAAPVAATVFTDNINVNWIAIGT